MTPATPFSLTGKIAVITGFGSPEDAPNNGGAIARLFARQGAIIEGLDISLENAQNTVNAITAEGGQAFFTPGNVTVETDIDSWIKAVLRRHDRIDILINNVGQSERLEPLHADTETWRAQLALNLDSTFYCMRAVLPTMIHAGKGAIVNISSIAGIRHLGKPQIAYNTAKAGLQQLTKTSALMHAKDGIRMNCILPGLINTKMVKRMAKKYGDGDYESYAAKRNKQVPVGYMGAPEDVAYAALYLASDEASYITGTELIVDGGITAMIPK